jgi:hypothetical protein
MICGCVRAVTPSPSSYLEPATQVDFLEVKEISLVEPAAFIKRSSTYQQTCAGKYGHIAALTPIPIRDPQAS